MVLTVDPPVIRPVKLEKLRHAEAPESLLTTKSAAEQFVERLLSIFCYVRWCVEETG